MKGGCGSGGECMHGRGIVCNDTGITGKLTSKLALRTALKSGPSGILLNCLHAHIVKQKCYARQTCSFGNRTSMNLKTSALVSH